MDGKYSSEPSCHPLEAIRAKVDEIHGEFVQIADAAKLNESKYAFPVIPNVEFICRKGDQIEEFGSVKDLDQWVVDCFDRTVRELFRNVSADGRTGYDCPYEWFKCESTMEDVEWVLDGTGWTVERRAV